MDTIKLDFCDFYPGFEKTDNYFHNLLSERFKVVICDQPDFLIYSPFGHQHRLHSCTRIYFSGESDVPDWNHCDYAITCHFMDDPRHLRVPFYVFYAAPGSIVRDERGPDPALARRDKFCSFVVSNHHPKKNKNRAEFFHRLSQYKRVESGGRLLNNIGGPIPNVVGAKVNFLKTCKFNIAFENAAIPGYTTEKLFEALQAYTLPIYWGNPLVARDFNPGSFLNAADFPTQEKLIEKIIELDQDDEKYLEILRQPCFHKNKPNEFFNRKRILDFFQRIFETKIQPVGQRRKLISFGRWIIVKRNHFR